MRTSEGIQTFMITLMITAGIYLLCNSMRDSFFPHTGQLLKMIETDLGEIKKVHPEFNEFQLVNLQGARGNHLAKGWALFAKESFPCEQSTNYYADVLLISQDDNQAIMQISISDKDNNFIKEVARTYSFVQ